MTSVIRDLLAGPGKLGSRAQELDTDTDLYQEGLTSYGSVGVLLGLEDAFDIEFPDAVVTRRLFSSIDNLKAAVETALAAH
ncbi:MAG: acyl carrier protein [Chloroflexi bacterium]|nr:acyl carrier protein [Chloroflexota bacterium]